MTPRDAWHGVTVHEAFRRDRAETMRAPLDAGPCSPKTDVTLPFGIRYLDVKIMTARAR
jgi:hypothetical protein